MRSGFTKGPNRKKAEEASQAAVYPTVEVESEVVAKDSSKDVVLEGLHYVSRFKPKLASLSSQPLIMGIDPGFNGAISIIEIDTLKIIDMIDMPTYVTKSTARESGKMVHLDVHALSSKVDMYAPLTRLAVLEDVMAMPEQGLSSTFRFGQVFGQIHGVMAGHYIPTVTVKPFVWKPALGLSHDKDRSRESATTIFSGRGVANVEKLWGLKKQVDRAEASLIAYYAIRYLQNYLQIFTPRQKVLE